MPLYLLVSRKAGDIYAPWALQSKHATRAESLREAEGLRPLFRDRVYRTVRAEGDEPGHIAAVVDRLVWGA